MPLAGPFLWTMFGSTGHAAGPIDRPPDAMVVSTCFPDSVGFVDVDGDGVEELTLLAEGTVFTWPTTRGIDTPVAWEVPGGDENDHVEMASGGEQPAQLYWMHSGTGEGDGVEYTADPTTMDLQEQWSEATPHYRYYISDLDGDGLDELTDSLSIRWSRTGTWQEMPWCCDGSNEYYPRYVAPVGDLNQDGYGDIVLGARTGDSINKWCSKQWGPAQLYLGSADGLQPEPVWTLFVDGHPEAGVGRLVVAIPGEDTLVMTIVKEGDFCDDLSEGYLGVIRNASTPEAYLAQVVEMPEYDPEYSMPYLYGLMGDGAGGLGFAMVESGGGAPDGVRWFPWDETLRVVGPESSAWAPAWIDLDVYVFYLARPIGRQQQALVFGNVAPDGTYELLIWGRTPEEVGPTGDPAGSTAAGCTFWSWPYVPPEPVVPPPADTGDDGPPPVTIHPPWQEDGCGGGCATAEGGFASSVVILAAAAVWRRRPASRP